MPKPPAKKDIPDWERQSLKTAMTAYGVAGLLFFIMLLGLGGVDSTRSFIVLLFGFGSYGGLSSFSAVHILDAVTLAKMKKTAMVTKAFIVSFSAVISILMSVFSLAVISPGADGAGLTALLGVLVVSAFAAVLSGAGMLYGIYNICKPYKIAGAMTVASLAVPVVNTIACVVIYRKLNHV